MQTHYFDDEKMNDKKEDYGDGFNANTQDIINFAMKKLHYGECKRDNVDIKNFQSQVSQVSQGYLPPPLLNTNKNFPISLDSSSCQLHF